MDDSCVVNTANNTITLTTPHFSKYMLVDRKRWEEAWSKYAADYEATITLLENSTINKQTGSVYKIYETGLTWDDAKTVCEKWVVIL